MDLNKLINITSKFDTPTMCNAMDVILGTRSATGFTRNSVVTAQISTQPIVGFAKTAKIRALSPPLVSQKEINAIRMKYYEYIVKDEKNPVVIIEDTDYPNCIGAFWGELNVAVHKGLKIKGTVTNGLLRDLGMLDSGYQVVAGGVGPSHAFVHLTELDTPVNILGLEIKPGAFIHADQHGAMTVPSKHLDALPHALDLVVKREVPILEAARKKGFNIEKLKEAFKKSWSI